MRKENHTNSYRVDTRYILEVMLHEDGGRGGGGMEHRRRLSPASGLTWEEPLETVDVRCHDQLNVYTANRDRETLPERQSDLSRYLTHSPYSTDRAYH